jgi:digeranylgeranylglycerophospholipid reductase
MDSEFNTIMLGNGAAIRARYIIGADGAYSIVRKTVFGSVPELMTPIEEFHSDAKADEGIMRFIVYARYGGAYQWYFPYGEGRCTGSIRGYAEPEPEGVRGVRTVP